MNLTVLWDAGQPTSSDPGPYIDEFRDVYSFELTNGVLAIVTGSGEWNLNVASMRWWFFRNE